MKTEQIILQLQSKLPSLSPYFSDRLQVIGMSKLSGTNVEIQTLTAHGLAVDDLITVGNIVSSVTVDTYTETATQITFTLLADHDFTYNANAPLDAGQVVKVYYAGVNYEYRLKSVPNRRTLIVYVDDQDPIPLLLTIEIQQLFPYGWNGLKQVAAVPSSVLLQYDAGFDVSVTLGLAEGYICKSPRISGAVDIETLIRSYTEQPLDEVWAFVVLGSNAANNDRLNANDATTTQGRQSDFRQKIITNFSIFIFVPNKGEVLTKTNGRAARDLIEDLRLPIFQSILGVDLSADLYAQGQGIITYNGDAPVSYDGAVYIHEFKFQQVIEITSKDTAIRDFERAFRDISLIQTNQFDDLSVYTAAINLDEEPL